MEKNIPSNGSIHCHHQIPIPAECTIHIIAQMHNLKIKTKHISPQLPEKFRKLTAPKLNPGIEASLTGNDAITARKKLSQIDFSQLLVIWCHSTNNDTGIKPYTCYRSIDAQQVTVQITAKENNIDIENFLVLVPPNAKVIVESEGNISLFSANAGGEIFASVAQKNKSPIQTWSSEKIILMTKKKIFLHRLAKKEKQKTRSNLRLLEHITGKVKGLFE